MLSNMLIVVLLLWVSLYGLRRHQERFFIRLEGAQFKVKRGQPPHRLIRLCEQLTQQADPIKGTIRGLKKSQGQGIVLNCSRSIPASYQQDIFLFWRRGS